jgi:Ca-activated chloride channel family protein
MGRSPMKLNLIPLKFIATGSIIVLTFLSPSLLADGFIIPQPRPGEIIPQLSVKYHRVEVIITDQVARTSIDQVFFNHHSRDVEGFYIFPLPDGASISEFSMFVGEKRIDGEILDRDRARKIYEDIVRRMKDPALLEYVGRKMFRARVFPIPAHGEKRIRLSYTEVLKSEARLVRYLYPLNTEKFSYRPLEEVAVSVELQSKIPLSNIYSPTHKVSVRKLDKNRARVSFEAKNVKPDKDFIVYYSLSEDDIGLSFMNRKEGKDGYFLFLASPSYVSPKEKIINKNVVFILDSSGSMSGQKIIQAKEAARFVINNLDSSDRFSLIDFDDGVDLFSPNLEPASRENIGKAVSFIGDIEDSGGTNINEALLQGLNMIEENEGPTYILFLTDGLPTVGMTDTSTILDNVRQANAQNTRVFVFGVGYDVNTELLDRISSENRGTSLYVSESDNLEVAISQFYEKMSAPVLSDLTIEFEGIDVRDIYPRVLPDLFKGSQLVLIGKYRGEGPVTVKMRGKVEKKTRDFKIEGCDLKDDESYNFLPRLWATRRIGYLLEEIRLHGPQKELIDEVRALGIRFGIVTPYTSFLVTEKERQELDAAAPEAAEALAAGKVTGIGAFRMAKATQTFKAQEQALRTESQRIRYRDDKTFYLQNDVWVDSVYQKEASLINLRFGSEQYFELLRSKPGIGKYVSVAKNILIVFEGQSYRITS